MAYYPQFSLALIDVDGYRAQAGVKTINAYNVTTGGSLGTLVSDADGLVATGSFLATAGDIVEFTHATYPGTFRLTLQDTAELAFTAWDNAAKTYVLENLYVSTTVASDIVDIWAQDLDNPDDPPFRLGSGRAGTEVILPIQSNIPKNLRIYPLSITDEFERATTGNFSSTNFEDVTIPALGFASLFDHITDATTTSQAEETLRINQIDALTLYTNGDKVEAMYPITLGTNANDKYVQLKFGGTIVFDSDVMNEDGSHCRLFVELMRISNTEIISTVTFATENPWEPVITSITGLTLDATDYDLELRGNTPDLAGDVISKKGGNGRFIPSSQTNTNYVTYLGETVTYGGDEVTYA